MSRKKLKKPQKAASPDPATRDMQARHPKSPQAKPAQDPFISAAGMREVVESIVIAFVLAFLFRTFEAEAFVIPTGSMAPTLMGRHKDVVCPRCGTGFQVSASDEVDSATGRLTGARVVGGTCPMCRYTLDVGPVNPQGKNYPSYKGDRILVSKFPYQFCDPQRWDVAVFKYPGGAKTNFIKRIVGLPGETVLISRGDLYVKPFEQEDHERFQQPLGYGDTAVDLGQFGFEIARKPPSKILAVLQPVYDNDRVIPELIEIGWQPRWRSTSSDQRAGAWKPSDDYRDFSTDGSAEGVVRLAYHHVVPSYHDWQYLKEGRMPPGNEDPRPQLITDFLAYNTDVVRSSGHTAPSDDPWEAGRFSYGQGLGPRGELAPKYDKLGLHWVGDLAFQCTLEPESGRGDVLFELVKGGRIFRCTLDLATGRASLGIDGVDDFHPTAATRVRGPGKYRVMFANVDDQLVLWVNGRVVEFDAATTYGPLGNTVPDEDDLTPVRVGAREAAVRIRHLKIDRDLYYIAERSSRAIVRGAITDFVDSPLRYHTPDGVVDLVSEPDHWDAFASTRQVAFPLDDDQFLVLGDNSAASKDSRLWEAENFVYYVHRDMLIGKALVIYWPHGWDLPGTDLPIKVVPNIWRILRFVR
jgi:signal peptidase I